MWWSNEAASPIQLRQRGFACNFNRLTPEKSDCDDAVVRYACAGARMLGRALVMAAGGFRQSRSASALPRPAEPRLPIFHEATEM